jgi:hypothetical protein
MIGRIIVFILVAIQCHSLCAFADQDIKEQIKEIKLLEDGREFFNDHSEENMYKIIRFVHNPTKHFPSILNIKDWCSYIQVWDFYLIKVKREAIGCFGTLMRDFCDVDEEKVAILTFLLSTGRNCGLYQEALSTRYSRLFSSNPIVFIEDLKKRKDWRDIIETLQVGDWNAFKVGLTKLGDSEFEIGLKSYASYLERAAVTPKKRYEYLEFRKVHFDRSSTE